MSYGDVEDHANKAVESARRAQGASGETGVQLLAQAVESLSLAVVELAGQLRRDH